MDSWIVFNGLKPNTNLLFIRKKKIKKKGEFLKIFCNFSAVKVMTSGGGKVCRLATVTA